MTHEKMLMQPSSFVNTRPRLSTGSGKTITPLTIPQKAELPAVGAVAVLAATSLALVRSLPFAFALGQKQPNTARNVNRTITYATD